MSVLSFAALTALFLMLNVPLKERRSLAPIRNTHAGQLVHELLLDGRHAPQNATIVGGFLVSVVNAVLSKTTGA